MVPMAASSCQRCEPRPRRGGGRGPAIVAREYRIPAVMGTGSGTSVLVDGQKVRVDGDRGLVIEARA